MQKLRSVPKMQNTGNKSPVLNKRNRKKPGDKMDAYKPRCGNNYNQSKVGNARMFDVTISRDGNAFRFTEKKIKIQICTERCQK